MAAGSTFNPDTATMDELRAKLADGLSTGELSLDNLPTIGEETEPAPTPARDAQGRFVAEAEEEEDGTPLQYVREIDLGDGSGVQVFKGDTQEELLDNIAEAQKHATRKIREQAAEIQRLKTAQPAPAATTPSATDSDENWLISQELLSNPTEAFKKLFKMNMGMTVEEFKTQQKESSTVARATIEDQTAREFMHDHPEFLYNPFNGKKVKTYFEKYSLPVTKENLLEVFTDLSQSGLLQAKSEDESQQDSDETEQQAPPTERIARPAQAQPPRRKVASGLTARRGTPVARSQGPTEAELSKLSMEELRQRAMESF